MDFIVFDIEGTDLDTQASGLHCISAMVHGTPDMHHFEPLYVPTGVAWLNSRLEAGDILVGLNIIEYDLPVLQRFGLAEPPEGQVYDLKLASRTIYPGKNLAGRDKKLLHSDRTFPTRLVGWNSLEAWGRRLGIHKGEYEGGWENYSEEMGRYCDQDVVVSDALFAHFQTRINLEAVITESEVGRVCRTMRLNGVGFNRKTAEELTVTLATRRAELTSELRDAFPTRYRPVKMGEVFVPKRDLVSKKHPVGDPDHINYAKGCGMTKVFLQEFNPGSNPEGAERLQEQGWKPKEFTPTGLVQLTGDILRDLDPARFPQAKLLGEFHDIKKIIGYIAEGDNAWLKLEQDGKLHGRINPVGTSTLRAAHFDPNTGQVPVRSEYGKACRAMFRPTRAGNVIVGADASGLQLRAVAHYLAPLDDGDFARQCETGDIHEYIRAATKLNVRAHQKTWTYAKLFGAQSTRLGLTVIDDMIAAGVDKFEGVTVKRKNASLLGKRSLANFGNAIPAWAKLEKRLQAAADRGYLRTLNGQRVPVPSLHLAIAILLQAFEACIMKRAMRIAQRSLAHYGDVHWMLWVHDEFQIECPPDAADDVGHILVEAMKWAGEDLECLVKIDGEYKVGETWADTH